MGPHEEGFTPSRITTSGSWHRLFPVSRVLCHRTPEWLLCRYLANVTFSGTHSHSPCLKLQLPVLPALLKPLLCFFFFFFPKALITIYYGVGGRPCWPNPAARLILRLKSAIIYCLYTIDVCFVLQSHNYLSGPLRKYTRPLVSHTSVPHNLPIYPVYSLRSSTSLCTPREQGSLYALFPVCI